MTVDIQNHHEALIEDSFVEREMMERENEDFLHRALLMLDPDKREIIILSKLEEMRYAEIGAMMGLSEGTVKVRVFRAMRELKDMVKNANSKTIQN